jgi:hypothetical protein
MRAYDTHNTEGPVAANREMVASFAAMPRTQAVVAMEQAMEGARTGK